MKVSGIGHALLAITALGLGWMIVATTAFVPPTDVGWLGVAHSAAVLRTIGFAVMAAGPCLLFTRTAPLGAILLLAYNAIWLVAALRSLTMEPWAFDHWYAVCEALTPLLGIALIYPGLRPNCSDGASTTPVLLHAASAAFGAAWIVYGIGHFAYAGYTAGMVPSWLPWPLGWAYLTGACHVAAGAAVMLHVRPHLAAVLEAIMMSLFGLLVWIPSFLAQPRPDWAGTLANQQSETLVTFLLAAAAWNLAAALRAVSAGNAR